MAILVTGAAGQLGSELCSRLGGRALGIRRADADLTDAQSLTSLLMRTAPEAVVNCAAYTAVDRAESDAERCFRVNAEAVGTLAGVCRRLDIPLVQVSTDYVFGGDSECKVPYREDDLPAPQGVYAASKLAGERQAGMWRRHFIVRTCGLYAAPRSGRQFANFPLAMLRVAAEGRAVRVVADQTCTPTHVGGLAGAILFLLETEAFGTYHVADRGETTWHGFAEELFRQATLTVRVEPITTRQYAAAAPRPAYSVLDTTKYHRLGGPAMPRWQDGIAAFLQEAASSAPRGA